MARIRTIKPEFWTSEQITECSVSARLLFIGLWNFCDDDGRLVDSPKQIKMRIFPGDDFAAADIEDMLRELAEHRLLVRYIVEEKGYIQIRKWKLHQKINRPNPSNIPEYCASNHGTLTEYSVSPTCRKGREGKGIELTNVNSCAGSASEPRTTKRKRSSERFTDWWNAYPKKIGRKRCEQIWRTRNLDTMADELISDVQNRMRVDAKWREGFIPNPQTYLNGDRWQDEIDHQKRAPPKGNGATDWLETGKQIGVTARPGETMEAYARRVRKALDANNRH